MALPQLAPSVSNDQLIDQTNDQSILFLASMSSPSSNESASATNSSIQVDLSQSPRNLRFGDNEIEDVEMFGTFVKTFFWIIEFNFY